VCVCEREREREEGNSHSIGVQRLLGMVFDRANEMIGETKKTMHSCLVIKQLCNVCLRKS